MIKLCFVMQLLFVSVVIDKTMKTRPHVIEFV